MNQTPIKPYLGPIRAVLLDWAGTTMDFGCMAPASVFLKVFEQAGTPITMEEARAPMGAHKRVHIQEILRLDGVRERWIEAHGTAPTDGDVDEMFAAFVPLQLECLAEYAELIPGTLEVVSYLRKRSIAIGTTTGYTTEMTAINLREAERQGFKPDATVSASEVPMGRPYPFMCLQNIINLRISPLEACVKVDDTIPGIAEGLNAGLWTIGLAVSGNEVGLSLEQWTALSEEEKAPLRERAYQRMKSAGAHYVVDTIKDIISCLGDIESRLSRGEKP
jgi:phosphonoacetaldehyde hydrolase